MFDLKQTLPQDLNIEAYNYRCYLPSVGAKLNGEGEFSIDIYPSGDYFQLAESFILFQGSIRKTVETPISATDEITFANGGPLHCFRLLSYSLNGTALESLYNPGVAVLLKTLATNHVDNSILNCFEKDTDASLDIEKNTGFLTRFNYVTKKPVPPGSFSILIPLKQIFAFVEDFHKVLMGVRQTIKFVRRNDQDALCRNNNKFKTDCIVNFTKVALFQPLLRPSDANRAKLLSFLKSKERFPVRFHENSLETFVLPQVQEATLNLGVRTSRPRFLLIALQTDRHDDQTKNPAVFDSVKIRNIYATLNNQRFPELDYQIDFAQFQFARPYYDFSKFFNKYYMIESEVARPLLTPPEYQSLFPIFCVDMSRQFDHVTEPCLQMTLKLFFGDKIPPDTLLQVLIISERFLFLEASGESFNIVY